MEPRRLRLRHGGLIVAALGGCAGEGYDRTDLQVDVDAPLPAAAATVHLCVAGSGMADFGAGNGRVAFTGLPAEGAISVQVEALDAAGVVLGHATAELDADTPYVVASWSTATTPCLDRGERAPAGADTRLLGVRFAETSWS
jgi:hypothetical protein